MKQKEASHSFRALAGAMQLPEDALRGNTLVSLYGQNRAVIENFRGISSYTTEEIRLAAKNRSLCIKGRNLRIGSYTKEEIEITGLIEGLEYL